MKRITAADIKRKDELASKLAVADSKLTEAISAFNAAQAGALAPLRAEIEAYNEVMREVDSFRDDIANEIESYIDERSDAWREGEKGDAYNQWLDAWQYSFEEIEIDLPQSIDEVII